MNNSDKILIGLTTTKGDNFSDWYRQTIIKSELISYGDISGCYIIRPNAYALWEVIQDYVNNKIKKMGVRNAYFPLFISKQNLETEKSHIEGFTPEVAWVTKAGTSELAEQIAIRPTSETAIYPHFSNWIRSYRDLPMKINQWCNVVRWEFKDPTPFIRTREILWQEGHSCFSTKAEADQEVREILNVYTSVYEDLLAVPVIQGKKSEKEKFGGADYTTTIECFIPAIGRVVQGATSHHLGQNFSKMFGIEFEDANLKKNFVYQNSWGITTRTIGVMIMVHGDNKGLVLPPRIAPTKIVIIPCGINSKTKESDDKLVNETCQKILSILNNANIPTEFDNRSNYRVGYKFNYWEMHGIPLRMEIGPIDVKNKTVRICRRDTGEKITINCDPENEWPEFCSTVHNYLEKIQLDMFARAQSEMISNISVCDCMENFISAITAKKMCLVPWCEDTDCENNTIEYCKKIGHTIKSLCIPFDQDLLKKLIMDYTEKESTKCFNCDNNCKSYTLFGCSF